jgi:uncharacterized protein (UPF0276 family)
MSTATTPSTTRPATTPGSAGPGVCGIGLRAPHYQDFLQSKPALDFIEVHSENFFGVDGEIGGAPRQLLERLRADYALSLHGVGLSLGSAEPVRHAHLRQLKWLDQRFAPQWMSDHLAWVGIGGRYANDLLPLPYTEEALAIVRDNVLATQDFLGRRILVENPSCYLSFTHSSIPEWEFMNALAHSADCGILLDINNVYVSAMNLGFDPYPYVAAIDATRVGEIHLAGFTRTPERLIDTHSRPVDAAVWALYEFALQHCGARPTLIEWDADLPALPVLLEEADHARKLLARHVAPAGGRHAGAA